MDKSEILFNEKCSICNYEIKHYKKRSNLNFVDCTPQFWPPRRWHRIAYRALLATKEMAQICGELKNTLC